MDLLILDGGIGDLLKQRNVEKVLGGVKKLEHDQLFIAAALANSLAKDLVVDIHTEYINAGCDIITTNSFGCTNHNLHRLNQDEDPALPLSLAADAGKIAREVADIFSSSRPITVAGSLPPLLESYQTRDLLSLEEMQPQYRQLAAALGPFVDVFLCETLSSVVEGVAAASVVSTTTKPWWISFSLHDSLPRGGSISSNVTIGDDDDNNNNNNNNKSHPSSSTMVTLRSGESLENAVQATVNTFPGCEAVLINCCAPRTVTAGIQVLKNILVNSNRSDIMIGGYANGFSTTTSQWLQTKEGGEKERGVGDQPNELVPGEEYSTETGLILESAYAEHAEQWRSLGARIIGGCCGIGPSHVAAVAQKLKEECID
jgi:S-methylmethionine-dependent homocysteine/selenocysteine methylase